MMCDIVVCNRRNIIIIINIVILILYCVMYVLLSDWQTYAENIAYWVVRKALLLAVCDVVNHFECLVEGNIV